VVKRGGEPGVHSVTSLTGRREFCVNVVGIGSQLKISRMARIALRRQPLELSCRGALVAGIAFQSRMSAHQREAVEVILNRLYRDVPAIHGVALFTIGAELSPVNVRVAIRTS